MTSSRIDTTEGGPTAIRRTFEAGLARRLFWLPLVVALACGGDDDDRTDAATTDAATTDAATTDAATTDGATTDGATTGDATTDIEAPASCDLLLPYVGTFTVTGEATEDIQRGFTTAPHTRGTVIVGADLGIDFDDGITFGPTDITVCYDRTAQDFDRRIQVSYGADDSGPVINLYLDASLAVTEIQYRHNNAGENVRVLVTR